MPEENKQTFTIYGISDCPSCLRACADAMDLYPACEYVFVNTDFSPIYRKKLKERYNMSTFPIILHNDELIGGYEELCSFLHCAPEYNHYSSPRMNKKAEPN